MIKWLLKRLAGMKHIAGMITDEDERRLAEEHAPVQVPDRPQIEVPDDSEYLQSVRSHLEVADAALRRFEGQAALRRRAHRNHYGY